VVAASGRTGEGGKGTETAGLVSSKSLRIVGWGSGRFRLSTTLVLVTAPVLVDLAKSALDGGRVGLNKSILEGGRVDLDKSILEGGRALEVVRARLCGGTSLAFSG